MTSTSRITMMAAGVLAGALLAGGSYALGAGGSAKTISGCVVTRAHSGLSAGELLIANRCGRDERPISWNEQGRPGMPGAKGQTGSQGPPAASDWASVVGSPTPFTTAGQNISVQNGGAAGVTTVTPLAPCTNGAQAAEVVTPTPSAAGVQAGQTPVAYVELGSGSQNSFQVVTGYLSGGTFTADSEQFSVAVYCEQS